MDENDDPIKEVNPQLAPANLYKNGLVDIDADITTNNSQPLTVEEITNDLNNEPHAESDDANYQNEENTTTIMLATRDKLMTQ